jgi:hypothetical protein
MRKLPMTTVFRGVVARISQQKGFLSFNASKPACLKIPNAVVGSQYR